MFKRLLDIPSKAQQSFFLWGPRQTGKSTYLTEKFPKANYIDLLDSNNFREFSQNPSRLQERLADQETDTLTLIDEIQKVPALLDEVQRAMVARKARFGLCGSSARKLRRGHANLLGGRAIRYEMFGLVSKEIGKDFDIVRAINHGNLPDHYLTDKVTPLLRSYVADYLKEEVAAEGLVRNLPAFSQFLDAAALADGELVSYSTFARDTGVAVNTVKEYFQILVDTLLARFLPSYTKRPKRRVILAPKFYFCDVGVVNTLAKRGAMERGSELFGRAFENWICHELHAYASYSDKHFDISYWRLASGIEVDFIVGKMEIALEAKATERVRDDHMRGLRSLTQEHKSMRRRIVICFESYRRKTSDGIEVIPWSEFLDGLWEGRIL